MCSKWSYIGCFMLVALTGVQAHTASAAEQRFEASFAKDERMIARYFRDRDLANDLDLTAIPAYEIDLNIDDSLSSYTVIERLSFQNKGDGLKQFKLELPGNSERFNDGRSSDFKIDWVKVNGELADFELEGDSLRITAKNAIESGAAVSVALEFVGYVPVLSKPPSMMDESLAQLSELLGAAHSGSKNYGVFSLSDGILSLAHFYAVLPHMPDPSEHGEGATAIGDEAHYDVANYRVIVNAPESLQIVTSGVEDQESVQSGRRTLYAAAFAAREFTLSGGVEFQKASTDANGVTVNCYLKKANIAQCNKLLTYASNALNFYSESFGAYPLSELDLVEAPLRGGAGGMEYSGFVTISSGLFAPMEFKKFPLFKEMTKISENSAALDMTAEIAEFTVAHEVAHQWWHALVGSDSRRDPYLDEPLTNYSTILYFEKFHGKLAARKQEYLQLELIYQLYRIAGNQDMPVARGTDGFKDTMQYGAMIYAKGALFYRALRSTIGDPAFFGFLKDYYSKNKFGYVTQTVFRESLRSAAGASNSLERPAKVEALFNRWFEGRQGDADIGVLEVDRFAEMVLGPQIFEGKDGQKARLILKLIGPVALAISEEE